LGPIWAILGVGISSKKGCGSTHVVRARLIIGINGIGESVFLGKSVSVWYSNAKIGKVKKLENL